ncbi:glycosyl transferase, group 1 [Acidovorax sp. JS42]|nr:glycosyl transferase, group 1 [Acidovorax sp. JS42]
MLMFDASILIFSGFYLPGYKGGGPIRTIANMLAKMGNEIQFSLITADRDLGDESPYPGITSDGWQQLGRAQVYYASPGMGWLWRLMKVIQAFDGAAMHLNSFFSFRFSILPLIFWRMLKPGRPVIVGPRGEFSQGALALKSPKKRAFIALTKAVGLYRGVIWHASTAHEANDIRRVMGNKAQIRVAVDIACPPPDLAMQPRQAGTPLRLVFLSRISPKKNLLGAIQMLQRVRCRVVFDVYGPAEDTAYWASCQEAAGQLPTHVQFNYCGALYPAQVPETMARYDLFYLPTLGENFGHVIAEALGCGLPVLIADTTPWRDLAQQKLGWDLPLSQPEQFVAAIESCSRMQAADYDAWRHSIRAWALANIGNEEAVEQTRQLFMNLESANEH